MRKGAVGGDRGWAAGAADFRFAVDTAEPVPAGDKRKNRKPMARSAAKMMVMGLVRRIALGRAMMVDK